MGASSLVMFLYYAVVVAAHNRLFVEYGSPTSIAAFAIVAYFMTLYYLVAEGIAEGMQPQVSFYHGAKQYTNIAKVVKLASIVTLCIGLLWLALVNAFPHKMIGLFTSGDPLLIDEATLGIRLHLAAIYLEGLIILASMYFMSIGKGSISISISVCKRTNAVSNSFYITEKIWIRGRLDVNANIKCNISFNRIASHVVSYFPPTTYRRWPYCSWTLIFYKHMFVKSDMARI